MYKLYVVVRSDLESLTPGKLAAQIAHAASQHAYRMLNKDMLSKNAFFDWCDMSSHSSIPRDGLDAEHFGTTIVKDGGSFYPSLDISEIIDYTRSSFTAFYGVVRDPTYPIRDGQIVHHVNIETCFWVFANEDLDSDLCEYMKKYKLYKTNHD